MAAIRAALDSLAIRRSWRFPAAVVAVAALSMFAWSNHFRNGFHFDDFHTILENPGVQKLDDIGRLLTDPRAFSTLEDHQSWRPVVTASVALDYWLAGGPDPLWFHVDGFLWYSLLLALVGVLFLSLMDACVRSPENRWFALFGTALFGLHPASAETVNYIIQRAEIASTLGVVAGLALYIRLPKLRSSGLYLVPVVLGMLAKLPAAMFAPILFVYVLLFEVEWDVRRALVRSLPAFAVCGLVAAFVAYMESETFSPTGTQPLLYRLTQPYVAWRYFASFFLPSGLSADSDLSLVSGPGDPRVLAGLSFVVLAAGFAVWASFRRELRPLSFGVAWFLLALVPTAWPPLAEVANDHRMFFAFVGVAFAVAWATRLLTRGDLRLLIVVAALVLPVCAYAVRQRNEVWRTEGSLWRDVIVKSPANPRGHINHGLALLGGGDHASATASFERARALMPQYSFVEVCLGIAKAGLGRGPEAEGHFRRALVLDPSDPQSYRFFARWLAENGRAPQAAALLEAAMKKGAADVESRLLLLQLYLALGADEEREALLAESLEIAPHDPELRRWRREGPPRPRPAAPPA